MFNALPVYESGPFSRQSFTLRGRRFFLGESGHETLRLLHAMHQQSVNDASGFWALKARRELTALQKFGRSSVLTLVIIHTGDDQLRRIAIWARGHLGGSLGTSVITLYLNSPDAALRKVAVHALKRMNAYANLQRVADSDPDPRIRRIAMFTVAKPFDERVRKFSRNVRTCETTGNAQPLLVNQMIDTGHARRPKSGTFIRVILQRIRQLVGRRIRMR